MNRVFAHVRFFVGLLLAIIVLVFALPANHVTRSLYDISGPEYHFILLLVDIPLIAAWSVSMYGFTRLSQYTSSIAGSAESGNFRQFSRGMGWFAWGLPIASLIGMVLNAIGNADKHFIPVAIITVNYLYLLLSIVALSYFGSGAHELALQNKIKVTNRSRRLLIAIFVLIGVFFCHIIAGKLHHAAYDNAVNSYYLPVVVVWLTVAAPYLYAWFNGLFAAFELILVARHSDGILYKRALQMLSTGLVTIIISLSGLQYFRSIIPRTGHLVLGTALVFTYSIYAVYTIGSLLLIFGVRRLKKFEDA